MEYFRRVGTRSLELPPPADLSDADLERRRFSTFALAMSRRAVPQAYWPYVMRSLRRKAGTEARRCFVGRNIAGFHPDGYGYSRYCELYTRWEGKLSPVMLSVIPQPERCVVDYAGAPRQGFDVVLLQTGEVASTAQIALFANSRTGTWGRPNYTYSRKPAWTTEPAGLDIHHVRASCSSCEDFCLGCACAVWCQRGHLKSRAGRRHQRPAFTSWKDQIPHSRPPPP